MEVCFASRQGVYKLPVKELSLFNVPLPLPLPSPYQFLVFPIMRACKRFATIQAVPHTVKIPIFTPESEVKWLNRVVLRPGVALGKRELVAKECQRIRQIVGRSVGSLCAT